MTAIKAFLRWALRGICLGLLGPALLVAATADRPNILWITSEDNGPQLGCYGDTYAVTPHLDALAGRGLRYARAWSNAPVCAPARTAIISGRYPAADGAEHMRSLVPLPPGARMFPQYLREAGYYCTNHSKEDYNYIKPDGVWNESSGRAHYRNRMPGQPFFAVFNITLTHESQAGAAGHTLVHDPARAPLPAYHPDTPEVRRNWAQYYDKITEMDAVVGERLRELAEAGLAEDTIVFYYGDHGAGIPRSKRWPYNTGLHVPLIVYFPPKYAHLAPAEYRAGGLSERLVSFVDLAPTLLSLAGLPAPATLQGSAFAGVYPGPAPRYLHGFRGRMDERYDLVRSVTDGRYVYLRHYLPHLPYTQYVSTMFRNPTMIAWEREARAGRLNAEQRHFWEAKPVEELYDLESDPWEVNNLAANAEHPELARLRAAEVLQAYTIEDLGFIPEAERMRVAGERSAREAFQQTGVSFGELYTLARRASDFREKSVEPFVKALGHSHAVLRYWGVLGLRIRGAEAVRSQRESLRRLFADESPSVRIVAAEALATYGEPAEVTRAVESLLQSADGRKTSYYAAIEALTALESLDPAKWVQFKDRLAALPGTFPELPQRVNSYVGRLLTRVTGSE